MHAVPGAAAGRATVHFDRLHGDAGDVALADTVVYSVRVRRRLCSRQPFTVDVVIKLVFVLTIATSACDVVYDLERPPGVCPASFAAVGDSYYERIAMETTWLEGETACQARAPRNRFSHLAVIGDDAELRAVRAAFLGIPVWIGHTDLAVEGMFVPITAEPTTWPPLTTPPWAAGQPNNLEGNQHCLQIDVNGSLDDKPCMNAQGEKFEPLCECDDFPSTFE